ncbi:MAG: hypothetical protein AAB625_00890 [Patescibacteria group bacterium]
MTKKIVTFVFVLFSLITIHYSLFPAPAGAVCPICTVAVAGGLGLSRYFGIDDSIIGIWSGGLMVSLTLWTIDWLNRKQFAFIKSLSNQLTKLLVFLFWVLLTYPPLFWSGIIGHPFNTILGIDKLVFGSILGFFAFIVGVWGDKKVREIKGKQLFNFQKVVFPVVSLLIVSLVLYFYGGYLYKL